MIKLTVLLVGGVMVSVVWATKRANARRRLAEFDRGARCISCEGTDVAVVNGFAQCRTCGHHASLAELGRVKLTEAEIATMTRPD